MLALADGGLPLWQDTRLGLRKKDDQNRSDPLAADQEPAKHGLWHEHAEVLREFHSTRRALRRKDLHHTNPITELPTQAFSCQASAQTFGYSKSKTMLEVSLKLLIHKLPNP